MKLDATIQKTVRIDMEIWLRATKLDLDLPTENQILNHIIKAGIDILEDKGATNESTPPDPIKKNPELVKLVKEEGMESVS